MTAAHSLVQSSPCRKVTSSNGRTAGREGDVDDVASAQPFQFLNLWGGDSEMGSPPSQTVFQPGFHTGVLIKIEWGMDNHPQRSKDSPWGEELVYGGVFADTFARPPCLLMKGVLGRLALPESPPYLPFDKQSFVTSSQTAAENRTDSVDPPAQPLRQSPQQTPLGAGVQPQRPVPGPPSNPQLPRSAPAVFEDRWDLTTETSPSSALTGLRDALQKDVATPRDLRRPFRERSSPHSTLRAQAWASKAGEKASPPHTRPGNVFPSNSRGKGGSGEKWHLPHS
ncbi:hypothetical protein E5288_WYG012119 [Bos mutus]|uniref:Uncharacterized protein n=1 Tax=Bos mutus TaxID=72004 RepID=A0A6B0R9H3_9CETA|nr:hypothetical protein [Bos mutus]